MAIGGPTWRVVHREGFFGVAADGDPLRTWMRRLGWQLHERLPHPTAKCGPCSVGMPGRYWWTRHESRVVDLLIAATSAGYEAERIEFGDPEIEARVRHVAAPSLAFVVPPEERALLVPPPQAEPAPAAPPVYDFRRAASGDRDD